MHACRQPNKYAGDVRVHMLSPEPVRAKPGLQVQVAEPSALVAPPGQALQVSTPPTENVPAGHGWQEPPCELKVPTGHGKHWDSPVAPLVLVPAGHGWQLAPAVGENVFTGHSG